MALADKIFGMMLVSTGLFIAVYYTIWQFLSLVSILFLFLFILLCFQPIISRKSDIFNYFLDAYYLFKLPALALIIGLLGIDWFITKTNNAIAKEKARKTAEAAKKKN